MKHPIPAAAQDDRLGFVGTAGSGKTYNSIGAEERILDKGGRLVHIDPLGVAYGLRLMANGKTPSPYNIIIFGGPHGDLPLHEQAGAVIGETVAGMQESCILDLSQLGTKAAERRFMLAFLTALYRKHAGTPLHIVFDEADMFAPQKLMDKEGEAAKLLGMMETIVRRGRIKGFIPWLITQRPAVLSKDILSQVDGLIAFKLTASQDRKALGDWIDGQADKEQGRAILAQLPTMQRGQGVIWVPGRGILETAQFPEKKTFDSSRTPKRGEKIKRAELKPVDLGALKDRLASVIEEVKSNDPKALKLQVADLKRQLAQQKPAPAADNRAALVSAQEIGYQKGYKQGGADERVNAAETIPLLIRGILNDALMSAAEQIKKKAAKGHCKLPGPAISNSPQAGAALRGESPPAMAQRVLKSAVDVNIGGIEIKKGDKIIISGLPEDALPPGEKNILIAAVQFQRVGRNQLGTICGYKRSSRNQYIKRLKNKGLIGADVSFIWATPEGIAALGSNYEPLPTGAPLQAYWNQRLPEGERKILGVLVAAYPEGLDRDSLDELTGYMRSSRNQYLKRLKARNLVDIEGSTVRANEALF